MADSDSLSSPAQAGYPADFVWGAATAAYQIEGAVREDGRGPSIWDIFSHTPGKTHDGDNGDVACDHYHRWREDIALMREMGLDAYRLSVAWPRIVPNGRGQVNPAGLDFYERLIDGLLEAGIDPYVTLYHWDLPQALQDGGGWANRDTAYAFADYAEIVANRLGDRVKSWITLNEPFVSAFVGNLIGRHAPGIQDLATALRVTHHLLLGHGLAVPRLRAATPNVPVGVTVDLIPVEAASDSEADRAAANRLDIQQNRLFLEPLRLGRYPAEAEEIFGPNPFPVEDGDMETIAVPVDFLGINYYRRNTLRDAPGKGLLNNEQVFPPGEYTTMNWEVYPDGLRQILERVHRDYNWPAYYVTENGSAWPDQLVNGKVDDPRRTAYLQGHFKAAGQALQNGVPLKGYFVWSLMDNFEWGLGYSQRFGLIYVDYPTEQRIWKNSAHWFRDYLAAR